LQPLHRAYFNGYAMWIYLNTPFLMAMPGFDVEEIAPWQEEGETWRVLRAKFPAEIAGHCPEQDFYVGPDFLLRRHDANAASAFIRNSSPAPRREWPNIQDENC
jgi:hypothetical protein